MSRTSYKNRKPYYAFLPGENIFRYMRRLIKNIIKMYPFAKEHGFRYYTDTEYRRSLSYTRKVKQKEKVRRVRGGSFHKSHFKAKLKTTLLERNGAICNHCKQPFEVSELTIDHIVPLFLGGNSNINNLQLLCEPCHRIKTKTEHSEWQREQNNKLA